MNESDILIYLKKHTKYIEETGSLVWQSRSCRYHTVKIGSELGTINDGGYRKTQINGKMLLVHRLIFLLKKGYLPKYIDHIDGNKLNNKIENLKDATTRENCGNRKSHRNGKLVGASFKAETNKWCSRIYFNKKEYHLGYFNTEKEAHKKYIKAKENINKYGVVNV